MQTPTPVARRGAATMGPIQAVLDSASHLPPPPASVPGGSNLDPTTVSNFSTNSISGAPPQLIAVSDHTLDMAILSESNIIFAVNLLDADKTRNGTAELSRIIFPEDGGSPRPGDELVPSDSIPAKLVIQGLEFSPAGSSLLIWGESYVAVARAPRGESRLNADGFGHGNGTVTRYGGSGGGGKWRWTLMDLSGYAVDILRQKVIKVSWHPASDNCLVLLTVGKEDGGGGGMHWSERKDDGGGGTGRAFVMLHVPGRERPEQVLPIPDGPNRSPPVAMDYGKGAGWQRFAIWIARRDGSVAALCPVVPQNARVDSEELTELWAATADKLLAARWERANNGGESQSEINSEVAHLEQQQAWLRENFGHVLDGEDLERQQSDSLIVAQTHSSDVNNYNGVRRSPRRPLLQDNIVIGRGSNSHANGVASPAAAAAASNDESPRGGGGRGDAGAACGLVVLFGAGKGSDAGAAVAELPTVLAVAYRAGCLDVVLVPAGVAPRWAEGAESRASPTGGSASAVLESLDLAERSLDKGGAKKKQGLALTVGTAPWSLLAATPSRLTTVTVTWAASVENGVNIARERAARGDVSGRLATDLRALLRERPDSSVAEVLFVPPSSAAGRIVGVTPAANPQVGHLVMARLSGGAVELANVAVVAKQATEVASAAKRARAQETPGKGDMLPPFEAAVQKAEDALEERRLGGPLGSTDRLPGDKLMSELDERGLRALEKAADGLVEGGIVVLEKLNLKTNTRLQTLQEVYEHQADLIGKLSKDVGRLRTGQSDAEARLEEICDIAEGQADRSAAVLAMAQAVKPDVSPAERAFLKEMKETQGYADRRKATLEPAAQQIEELRAAEKEVEDSLLREADSSAAAGGLTEEEARNVWTMLKKDRERILVLSQRLRAAQTRMAELGVREEE